MPIIKKLNSLQRLAALEELKEHFESAIAVCNTEIEKQKSLLMDSDDLMQSAKVTFKNEAYHSDRLFKEIYKQVKTFLVVPCTLYRRIDLGISLSKDFDKMTIYRAFKRMKDERFKSLVEEGINSRTLGARINEFYDKKSGETLEVLKSRLPPGLLKYVTFVELPKIVKVK